METFYVYLYALGCALIVVGAGLSLLNSSLMKAQKIFFVFIGLGIILAVPSCSKLRGIHEAQHQAEPSVIREPNK